MALLMGTRPPPSTPPIKGSVSATVPARLDPASESPVCSTSKEGRFPLTAPTPSSTRLGSS